MSLPIGATSFTPHAPPVPPAAPFGSSVRRHASAALEAAFEVDLAEVVPPGPPPELRAEVQFAAQRAAQLAADDRELHFTKDEETGRVIVQVRDLEGNVIRTIPAQHALDVLAGLGEV